MDDAVKEIIRKYREQERYMILMQEEPEYDRDEETMSRIAALGGMLSGLEFSLLAMGYNTDELYTDITRRGSIYPDRVLYRTSRKPCIHWIGTTRGSVVPLQ